MNKNKINEKKEKEPTPAIVTEPHVNHTARPVQSSHFEPQISPYYPSGQKILIDGGKSVTYENYKSFFKTVIDEKEIKDTDDKTSSGEAKKKFDEDVKKFNTYALIYNIFLKLFESGIITAIFSIPILIFINLGIQNIDGYVIAIYYIVILIIILISGYLINVYGEKQIKQHLVYETSYQRYIDLKKQEK